MKTAFSVRGLYFLPIIIALWSVSISSVHADALDNWTPGNLGSYSPGSLGSQLLGVTYGNGRYVAVGQWVGSDSGIAGVSSDGLNWTFYSYSPTNPITDLFDVTYGSGIFVAVGWGGLGNPNIFSSVDGIGWTSHPTGMGNISRVVYGTGEFGIPLFVAVGDGVIAGSINKTNYNIFTSPDGFNWTAPDSDSEDDVHSINDVAFGAGAFVAVDDAHNFYFSSTGTSWARTFDSRAGSRISFCNGLFFVPSGPGTNLVSTNGLTWSVLTNDTGVTFGRLVYGHGLYIAQTDSSIFSSSDGTDWAHRGLQVSTNVQLRAIAFGNRNLAVAGHTLFGGLPILPKVYVSGSFAGLDIGSGFPPQLTVSGLLGHNYRIDYLLDSDLSSHNWQPLSTFPLTNSPYLWTDYEATNSSRFYRSVLLP